MGDRLNDSLTDVEGFCDKCGYISQDFVESGLHALECEGVDERQKEYKCETCKDNTSPIWGIETREFCCLVKEAYEKVLHFRPNTHTVPANNVGKEFYDLYADTLEMADADGTKNHFGWYANMILHPISLQIKDRKAIQKQKTANLKETINKMKNGKLSEVIAEAIATQNKLTKRKKKKKRKKSLNWISTIRNKVQEGELNAASRILKEDEKGVDELLQRMTAMFPRRQNREELPKANPTATRLTHFKPQDLLRGIMRLQ